MAVVQNGLQPRVIRFIPIAGEDGEVSSGFGKRTGMSERLKILIPPKPIFSRRRPCGKQEAEREKRTEKRKNNFP
ncbi:hypothetical protein U1Q18_025598, partial [Sarracenia purpurea var. burkii]